MNILRQHPILLLAVGMILGGGLMSLRPQQPLAAGTANSSDKFSMVTVPVEGVNADTEAVFVLDHLTGILRGGRVNPANGQFGYQYFYNVGGDFQVDANDPNPTYTMVSGEAQLRGAGNQPARGVIYIAEKNSGAVIAYGFPMPRRPSSTPLPLFRMGAFSYRDLN